MTNHDSAELAPASVPAYVLTRKRMRSIRMRVDSRTFEVRVSAPMTMPQWRIDAFVASRSEWITDRIAALAAVPEPLEHGPEAERARATLEEWLDILMPLWCAEFDVVPPHVSLRIMRSRWGSCRAATRRISLNLELARRGYEMTEYVLVHELAHLFELNHGPRFYALMDRHLPDWRERKARLGPL
ncbi:M48 family metallopeptidase [Demequina sp. NBRC 110056]|uniref:M48 family metallopeptidase n=1 Tax=Demequina sp. NBRC 110056 TaxID=1570345 RepID=UPI001F18A700|nr:YgjP-like metallopeptidase domain-containing protein [Demequina sp. NBRC 110056]